MLATHFIILLSTESTVQSVLNIYTLAAAKHTHLHSHTHTHGTHICDAIFEVNIDGQ